MGKTRQKQLYSKSISPFKKFPTYLEIRIYLGEICRNYPHLASIEIIGITAQQAEIYMIRLQKDSCIVRSQVRDIIFVDGTIHGHDWLTTSTAMYFISYIIKNHYLLDHASYYVVPCVNVDGYVFSMGEKSFRLWRKNRALNNSADVALQGVDLNRNFPIGYAMAGSSDDPGAFNFRGDEPLCEPEAKALSFALKKYHKHIKLYISLHCYGNAILYPWCFTKEPTPDSRDLMLAGTMGQHAFYRASGGKRKMQVGNSAELVGHASGTSTDYARYVHRIQFCYIFQLQGYGPTGFTPRARHIPQIGYETAMAIFAMTRHVQAYYRRSHTLTDDVITVDDDLSLSTKVKQVEAKLRGRKTRSKAKP